MKLLMFFLSFIVTTAFMVAGASAMGIDNSLPYAIGFGVLGAIATPSGVTAVTFTQGLCEKIQASLIEVYKNKAPALLRTPVGYLEAIMSPQNRANIEVIPIDLGTGKKREVRLKILNRGVESDIVSSEPAGCIVDLEKEPFEETISINHYLGTKGLGFNEDEMRKLCEADDLWRSNIIRSEINPLIVSLDKALITLQAANFGKFNPDIAPASSKDIPLLYGDKNEPLYFGESSMLEDFSNIEYSGRPLVIGAGKLGHYVRQTGIGCCNDGGVNLANAGNLDFFRDKYIESILGVDHFVGLVPGYVQLLTWNKYKGDYRKENDVFSHSTFIDPFTGLEFDMKVHYDDCNDKFYMQFGIHYEPYFLPSEAWAYGDELSGVNYTLHYKATKQVCSPCEY